MFKNAFAALELLIVIIIIITIYFVCLNPNKKVSPFEDNLKIKSQGIILRDKIDEIEKAKKINKSIENNLKEEF